MVTTDPSPRQRVAANSPEVPLGLTRTATHVYTWSDGRAIYTPLPSVTTILRVIDKSAPLVGWAKRETAACAVRNLDMLVRMRDAGGNVAATDWLKKIPDYQRDSAADVGSRIHLLAEQINRGIEPTVSTDEAPFIASYRQFLADFSPRFLAIEEMVCSLRHGGWAGTLDGIALIGGEIWMLDLKTGSSLYAETALQLAAYASADFIGRPGSARRLRLPRATRFGAIHVRPEGARLVEYAVDRGTFAAFLEARRLYAWQQGPAKFVVGKPVIAGERSAAA